MPVESGDIRVLREFLHEVGYRDDLIRSSFPIWLGRRIETVDLCCFGRARPADMTTATIIGRSLPSKAAMGSTIEAAQAIACPAAVFAFPDSIELWSISAPPGSATQVGTAPREDMGRLARRFRGELGPEVLLGAKRLGRQAALFPVDVSLLSNARRSSSEHLAGRVGTAMDTILSPLPQDAAERAKRLVDASTVVVGALAALMVRDRDKAALADVAGEELFREAAVRFPGYFDWLDRLDSFTREHLNEALAVLGDDVDYEGLEPGVVSKVYETAVVSKSDRLDLGIFYTPPDLAHRLVEHIPFEELAPEERIVLDPACGSGTLLLAAYDRLQGLAPAAWDPFQQHEYLISHLAGYDTDQFAVEIAKLSLLLHALPVGNRWDIKRLDTRSAAIPSPRPSVVISNPPWRDERSRGGVRRQLADDFLEQMLRFVKPQGFVAVLLPAGWLSAAESKSARQLVRDRTDLFEVWRLPEGTFGGGQLIGPCVLIARAKPPSGRPWVFRRVLSRHALPGFYETGAADEQFLAWSDDPSYQHTLLRGPLDEAGELLSTLPTLRSLALVQNGPVPEPPAASRGGEGDFLWLRHAGKLPAFGQAPEGDLIPARFPDEFHRAGTHDGRVFSRNKILVSAKRKPYNPWRLKVGLDLRGVIPRESLYMIIPHEERLETLFALVAILGSSVASCWVDSYNPKMAIDAQVLNSLPIPPPNAPWSQLARVGRRLTEVSGQPTKLLSATREADRVVAAAYGLSADVVAKLQRHFGGFTASDERVPRYPAATKHPLPKGVDARSFGAVLGIEGKQLRLWVSGATEDQGEVYALPDRFMGWHCHTGATFEVSNEDEGLRSAQYYFQRRSYQDWDQLSDELSALPEHELNP